MMLNLNNLCSKLARDDSKTFKVLIGSQILLPDIRNLLRDGEESYALQSSS